MAAGGPARTENCRDSVVESNLVTLWVCLPSLIRVLENFFFTECSLLFWWGNKFLFLAACLSTSSDPCNKNRFKEQTHQRCFQTESTNDVHTSISRWRFRLGILSRAISSGPVSESREPRLWRCLCLRRWRLRLGEGLIREWKMMPWPSARPWDRRKGVRDLHSVPSVD